MPEVGNVTTGRPPIRPYPDDKPPVVSGLGADERMVDETVDDNEFLCEVCNGQDAIFGVEDGADEELNVSDEGGQAVRIAPLPGPFQPTLSQFVVHCATHDPFHWVPVLRGRPGPRVWP